MASHQVLDNSSPQQSRDNQHFVALANLMQVAPTMHHIDDLWLWLTQAMTSRFDIQVAQIWATQLGQPIPELRSMACQDTAFPQNIVINTHIATVAQRLLSERHTSPPQVVDKIFPQYLAILLKRHKLNYSANYFLSSDLLHPPANSSGSAGKVPTPLGITVVIFVRQIPAQDTLPTIGSVCQQALTIASDQRLLLPAETKWGSSLNETNMDFSSPASPALSKLIPHRIENPMSNPIAASVAISDKLARRLYAAIDDRRNVSELCTLTRLAPQEIYRILQTLVAQQRVQVYESSGRLVDFSPPLHGHDR